MLVHHFVKWLAGDARRILPGWEGFALTDIAAPAFAIAAGASALLFAESRRRAGTPVIGTLLRRYGMLIPIGIVLQQLTSNDPWDWGVLQTLGAGVVISTLLSLWLPAGALAAVFLVAGPLVEHVTAGRPGYLFEILGGTFPVLTYAGFALVGATGARLLLRDESRGRQALLAGGVLVGVALLIGDAPDRYPGDVSFIVPGLAGTLLLYGAVACWQHVPRTADAVLRRAGTHSLGIFLAHYAVFWAINRYGLREELSPAFAVVVALVATIAFALVAPRVPQLPWSPRTGWRDQKRWASSAAYRATTASVSAVR